jgi:caa(3)-type oxidase subunit IV
MSDTQKHDGGHSHPNYVAVWAVLVALLAVGIAVGFVGNPVLGTVLVFAVATAKATLVAANYMHLRFEPLLVRVVFSSAIACFLVFLIGLIPDIVYGFGR